MNFIKRIKKFLSSRNFAFLIGLSATIWFLIRVIPKPSRAQYPCMRIAAPLMSTFVIYLLGVSASVFSYRKIRQYVKSSRYLMAGVFLLLALASFFFILLKDPEPTLAATFFGIDETFPVPSNEPVGEAKGLFPGRVVWVHDADATNENYNPSAAGDDWWYTDNNADPEVISEMLALALKKYAETEDITVAWDRIFTAFNGSQGRGNKGYTAGEKIAIKINLTNGSGTAANRMDAAPQLVNAILHELTVHAGVAQEDITLGDPYREFRKEYRDMVMSAYPDVHYVDGNGGYGVEQTVPSSEEELVFSDKQYKSTLPQHYLDATYFINIPCLKTHNEGGITLIAKNHQGSYLAKGDDPASQYAILMHYSLPGNSRGQEKYRHTVDYMGHGQTGGKGLIYIIDGIWGGESWQGWIKKFKSDPFNNDYPNSIFIGQDPVAMESVCFDVLFEEYVQDAGKESYPITMKNEIADYLYQCASSDYWPDGITYDPEGDGTPMGSLGVFEHWNNAADRHYSRNLGTGSGIELNYYNLNLLHTQNIQAEVTVEVAPNPLTTFAVFSVSDKLQDGSCLRIYNMKGQLVNKLSFTETGTITWYGEAAGGNALPNGMYLHSLTDHLNREICTGKISISR
ncbi:MAG: DUF362 domain-containing protein [Bacteroidales bacterium]|nr:DUF362 domain-containing protein [Bacteroidales bacterium]